MNRLRSRPEYQAAAKGTRIARPAFVLQAIRRNDSAAPSRFGFTTSRRVGGAVVRNRIRRRLKDLARQIAEGAPPGFDFVLVAKLDAVSRPFAAMAHDLAGGVAEAASRRPRRSREAR